MAYSDQKTPWWMTLIIVLLMLPALVIPMSAKGLPSDGTEKWLMWLYPTYVIATGICTYITYPQRKALAFVLLVLLVMSHISMYLLAKGI